MPKEKLILDTTICIDLFHGNLLEKTTRLPYDLVLPDVIAEELIDPPGDLFIKSGFSKLQLDEKAIKQIIILREHYPRASTNDLFALLPAKINSCILITGDADLRKAADEEELRVHGLFWILDKLVDQKILTPGEAAAALGKILAQGSWLPKKECEARFKKMEKLAVFRACPVVSINFFFAWRIMRPIIVVAAMSACHDGHRQSVERKHSCP